MLNRHNFIVTSSNYAQTPRKGIFLGGKGMIACNFDSLRQSFEQRRSVINVDLGRLSVHEMFRVINVAAECFKLPDGQDRHPAKENPSLTSLTFKDGLYSYHPRCHLDSLYGKTTSLENKKLQELVAVQTVKLTSNSNSGSVMISSA